MNGNTQTKNVFVVVKTYPTPSKNHIETVCTAGITDSGEWIRLYPVKFRYLLGEQQYKLYTWINVQVLRNKNDTRPESFKVISDSLKVVRHVDARKGFEERKALLLPLVRKSMEQINEEYVSTYRTLAIFKPKQIIDFTYEPVTAEWTDEEKAKLGQMSIFDTPETIPTDLQKVPYTFRCKYLCDDPKCNGHNQKITIWDFNWAFFQYRAKYGNEQIALEKLKEKWLGYFSDDRDGYLIVGTSYPHRTFIIIGIFSVKREENRSYQPRLFLC